MVSKLPSTLDNLAANGIIDFDADSYIKGTAPRYVGNPNGYQGLPFEQPLPAFNQGPVPQMHEQPGKDAFISKNESENPSWKKALAGVLIAGLAIFTGIKLKSKINSLFNKNKNKPVVDAPKSAPVNAPAAATATAEASATVGEAAVKEAPVEAKKGLSRIFEKIANLPKSAKIAGGSILGLLGLYGIYKVTTNHNAPHHVE